MATCTVTIVPPPPPPPVEKKIVLELNELEAEVLHAVLSCVHTSTKHGDVSYNILNALCTSGIKGASILRL